MLVIGKLRQRPLSIDVWSQLPLIGQIFRKSGRSTSNLEASTHISTKLILTQSSTKSVALLDRYGNTISAVDIKCLLQKYKWLSVSLSRPVSWTEG